MHYIEKEGKDKNKIKVKILELNTLIMAYFWKNID